MVWKSQLPGISAAQHTFDHRGHRPELLRIRRIRRNAASVSLWSPPLTMARIPRLVPNGYSTNNNRRCSSARGMCARVATEVNCEVKSTSRGLHDEVVKLGYQRSCPAFTRALRLRGPRPACEASMIPVIMVPSAKLSPACPGTKISYAVLLTLPRHRDQCSWMFFSVELRMFGTAFHF